MQRELLVSVVVAGLMAGGCEKRPSNSVVAPAATAADPPATAPATPPATQPVAGPARETPPPTRKRAQWEPSDDPKLAKFLDLEAPKPATWAEHPPQSRMRVTTFTVPGRDGHDAAHIVVFHFGPDQGGTVEQNIDRWQTQFKPDENGDPLEPIVERFEADGMPITFVEFAGDWMKMGTRWFTPDQLFLAAIVESPQGYVFIRFAGNATTVDANRDTFVQMIRGLRRSNPE